MSPPSIPTADTCERTAQGRADISTCGHDYLSHSGSPPKEDTRRGSIDSLFLSTSSFRSIMLLDPPQITAAQQLPLDGHF